jgi:four helix bundle protein
MNNEQRALTYSKRKDPAFNKAILLSHMVYDLMPKFPKDEMFGICSQLKRASLSVMANLAEGYARRKPKVFINHLEISYGSLMEVKSFLFFSCQREFISPKEYNECWQVIDELAAILWTSIKRLEQNRL